MPKSVLKNLVWVVLPLGFAVGCAANHTATTEAAFEPLPAATLTPTAAEPESRIYVSSGTSGMTSTPGSASPQTWALAQEIQDKLLSDPSLASEGSSLVAQVAPDGTVTLQGNAASKDEQQRVRENISSLPGVRGVNDQTTVGGYNNGPSTINMQQQ